MRVFACFFLNLPVMFFPKFVWMTKNKPFFQILHVFAPLNDVHTYSAWSWKTTLNYLNFWMSLIPPLTFECPPRKIYHNLLQTLKSRITIVTASSRSTDNPLPTYTHTSLSIFFCEPRVPSQAPLPWPCSGIQGYCAPNFREHILHTISTVQLCC